MNKAVKKYAYNNIKLRKFILQRTAKEKYMHGSLNCCIQSKLQQNIVQPFLTCAISLCFGTN